MDKIWSWLTGNVIKEVGGVLDNLITSKEEKLEAKKAIEVILQEAEANAQEQVTRRWESDMKSDSFLSKNIRPMVLIYLTQAVRAHVSQSEAHNNTFKYKCVRAVHLPRTMAAKSHGVVRIIVVPWPRMLGRVV